MDKDRAFKCRRLGKHIVKDEGHTGSERHTALATAGADLDHYDVSLAWKGDKSSDIPRRRQRIVSK